ncbi:MAG: hypothetical protein HUJ61_03725, partial [Bacilli bacterium]|nr:hypothetical protein [Bacilli bacterium]
LHESDDLIEKIGIDKAKKAVNDADLILFVLDETGVDPELELLIKDKKHIVVQNKSDLIKNKNDNVIYVSALNNEVEPLIKKIKEVMEIGELVMKPSFNNARQLGILKNIVFNLETAVIDAKANQPIDLVSTSVLLAYNKSLDLLGQNNKNDLSDEIFSRFCVGK